MLYIQPYSTILFVINKDRGDCGFFKQEAGGNVLHFGG